MEKTYLQLYPRNDKFIKFFMGFTVLIAAFGILGLASNLLIENKLFPNFTLGSSILFLLLGITYFLLLLKRLGAKKFHISWDDKEIHYFLPKEKQPEQIKINDIETITINEKEIKMVLNNDQEKRINLNYVYLPQKNQVREFFETLKRKKIN